MKTSRADVAILVDKYPSPTSLTSPPVRRIVRSLNKIERAKHSSMEDTNSTEDVRGDGSGRLLTGLRAPSDVLSILKNWS